VLKPYRMLLFVQGSISVLHNDALGFNRDKIRTLLGRLFDMGLVIFMVVCYDIGIS